MALSNSRNKMSKSSKTEEESTKKRDKIEKCYENYILIDIGAYLTHKKYMRDLESVIKRAKDSGRFPRFSYYSNQLKFIIAICWKH